MQTTLGPSPRLRMSEATGPRDAWVLDVLEPDQLVGAKEAHYPRARLGRGTRALMWGMRAYVIFMLVVVGYQVWTTIHPAGG